MKKPLVTFVTTGLKLPDTLKI